MMILRPLTMITYLTLILTFQANSIASIKCAHLIIVVYCEIAFIYPQPTEMSYANAIVHILIYPEIYPNSDREHVDRDCMPRFRTPHLS